MNPVRWGVLGAASIATSRFIPAMKDASAATLVAVASRETTKAEALAKRFDVPRYYGSYDELMHDPDIEALYVPLPNHLHLEWSVRALEAGKHVLCEKPLCMTSADIVKLLGKL